MLFASFTVEIQLSKTLNELTLTDCFKDKKVLITGGLGFIGSNLAIRLLKLGAYVTLLDAMIEGHGGNLFNIEPVRDDVILNFSDIRDANSMNYIVRGKDYIFHLAGQNDHVLSLTNPFPDIDINIKGVIVSPIPLSIEFMRNTR